MGHIDRIAEKLTHDHDNPTAHDRIRNGIDGYPSRNSINDQQSIAFLIRRLGPVPPGGQAPIPLHVTCPQSDLEPKDTPRELTLSPSRIPIFRVPAEQIVISKLKHRPKKIGGILYGPNDVRTRIRTAMIQDSPAVFDRSPHISKLSQDMGIGITHASQAGVPMQEIIYQVLAKAEWLMQHSDLTKETLCSILERLDLGVSP
jgi:hypothetical protein